MIISSTLVKTTYFCASAGAESTMVQLAQMNSHNKPRKQPVLAKQVIDKGSQGEDIL
jgi:hypothetical protein